MNGIRLVRGAAWNLAGFLVPLAAALYAVPGLVGALGPDRFGVLALAWILVGYFTLFDLGISPAVTRTLAAARAAGRDEEARASFWTAMLLTFGLGALGAVILVAASPLLVGEVLRVPQDLRAETLGILGILAVSLPFVTTSAAAGGALAAYQRFGALNGVRVPLGVLAFLAPLAVTPWTTDLRFVGAALVASRIAGALANLALCARFIPAVARGPAFRREAARPLLGFGGWMTVSAIAGPFMVYLDRFLIGALLSLAMVAYYTTPYDLAARLLVLAQSMVGVLFPAVAADFERDPARVVRLFGWGVRLIAALVFPATFLLVLFAPEGMTLWLGEDFARHAAPVLRWIAAGVFLNCLGQLALSIVQASGRPRWSALLHLAELPFYLAALVWFVRERGIEGAAIAWFLRVLVDTALLFALAARRVEGGRRPAVTAAGLGVVALAAMAAGAALPGLPARVILAVVLLAAASFAAYRAIWIPGRTLWVALLGARAAST